MEPRGYGAPRWHMGIGCQCPRDLGYVGWIDRNGEGRYHSGQVESTHATNVWVVPLRALTEEICKQLNVLLTLDVGLDFPEKPSKLFYEKAQNFFRRRRDVRLDDWIEVLAPVRRVEKLHEVNKAGERHARHELLFIYQQFEEFSCDTLLR